VTVAGAVLEPDGRVVAGPTGKGEDGGGVLVRQSELDALAVKIEEAGRELGAAREALQSLDGTAARLADELARVRAALGAERSAIAGEQSRVEQLSTDAGRLERERISLEGEIASLRQRSAQLERERGELITRAEQLRGLHADQLESAGKLEAQANQAQADADAVLEKITAAKVNAGRLAEQLSSARRERQQVEWSIEEGRRRMGTLQNNLKTRQAALVEQNQIAAEARALIASAAEESQELHKQVIGAAHAVSGAVAAAHALGEQLQTAREHARAVERDWHSLEVAKREGEIKREGMEDKIGVELAMDHAVVYGEYLEMIWGQEPLGAMDHVATQARVDELREDIKALGNVNLDAIEEESQLAGRNDSLAAQVADLDQARRDLSSLIEQLNSASRERFRITFEAIQEHFAGEQGMFRRLFGGGKAEVKLMPLVRDGMETTDTDWLESGIEIVARPPGKQPHVISQLSGGEKAMTAVALLMSIFRSKPSCFCILDEVDAALDDANVERFAGVVRQFTSFSHFIVITHHKRTMHSADQLYGVTMQERGVSTRVNVKLEQVGAGGEIKSASEPDSALRRGLAGMREAQNAKV
jgi:chromosome segregation protein